MGVTMALPMASPLVNKTFILSQSSLDAANTAQQNGIALVNGTGTGEDRTGRRRPVYY